MINIFVIYYLTNYFCDMKCINTTQTKYLVLLIILLISISINAQNTITGHVSSADGALELVNVVLDNNKVVQTDIEGRFEFQNIENGSHQIEVSYIGYKNAVLNVDVPSETNSEINITMESDLLMFDDVVVTGTKTFKRKTKAAVIVNVVDSKTLDNIQACNLSEGLKFQPGLRVETDCQTCNYTQLRMNGLAGGYSQILINGRPIFSPLTGLYGLEQIPVNMIDRIEVVRGGGSSLYGSSAIGGTVNVLTKVPTANSFSVNTTYQNINGGANDFMLSGNSTTVSKDKNSGISFFINRREREAYDDNADNFSEIPEIKNTSIGTSVFLLPSDNQKIELSLSHLNEYRYGGEIVDQPAHLALQSEERTHNVWMGSADYQINLNNDLTNVIAYGAWQRTDRDHYTGIIPDEDDVDAFAAHLAAPPYGTSLTTTLQGGLQLNHNFEDFLGGSNVFTFGAEYLVDDTYDEIDAYRYLIDQRTTDFGVFAQSDWELLPSLNLLSGVRVDRHNLVDGVVASPRLSLLYKYKDNTQIRASYGTGFRAPQAFDTDLHIAFAGGGISRVLLSDDLIEETSKSYSASINYDRPTEHWVAGFTVEGFYTQLDNAFILEPIGEDDFGELFEKRNDQGATVKGTTIELRANYNRQLQLETGLTIQTSRFDNKVQYIDEVEGIEEFIRTPETYGFANVSFTPNTRWNANVNYVYTGSMIVPHFAGAPNQTVDEIINSPSFSEVSTKIGYKLPLSTGTTLEVYGGVKNIFNSYQSTFDIGKNRDSNFVFGPAQPRTFFVGVKWTL